jgi:hypothetical protein
VKGEEWRVDVEALERREVEVMNLEAVSRDGAEVLVGRNSDERKAWTGRDVSFAKL